MFATKTSCELKPELKVFLRFRFGVAHLGQRITWVEIGRKKLNKQQHRKRGVFVSLDNSAGLVSVINIKSYFLLMTQAKCVHMSLNYNT